MNPFVTQLLNQALNQAKDKALKAAPGFAKSLLPQAKQFGVKAAAEITKAADDFIPPVLRGVATKANPGASQPQVIKSLGTIKDQLVRPVNREAQESLLNPLFRSVPSTFYPGASGQKLINQQLGVRVPVFGPPAYNQTGTQRFLQEFKNLLPTSRNIGAGTLTRTPGVTPSFPLDNPLARLQGNYRYLTRQGQGLLQQAQSFGPTALNPLASRVPTTNLGKLGSFLNPLNPTNARNLGIGLGINTLVPDDSALKGNLEIFAYTPGSWPVKAASALLFGAVDAGPKDEMALIKQQRQAGIRSDGGDLSLRNEEGKYWAGKNWGFQSPESINKLYGTNLPTGEAPSPPNLPPQPLPSREEVETRAGQLTPTPAPLVDSSGLSNGAGDLRQRQNVQERALSQEVLNAAQQYAAPSGVPLSSFYAGQQQLGRSMMQTGELPRQLKELGGVSGMSEQALMQWAQKNPGLAYREFLKLKGRVR